jgi:hypothetical protein
MTKSCNETVCKHTVVSTVDASMSHTTSSTCLTCYVCQEDTDESLFCKTNICKCTGTNRIHKKCFQKLHNQEFCSICNCSFENVAHLIVDEILTLSKVEEIDELGWKHEYSIDQKGRKQGSHRIYYKNGLLWEETYYKNDLKNGYQKVWDYKGKMFVNRVYKSGIAQN